MGQKLSSYLTINRCKIWTVAMKPCVVIVLLMMVVKHNNGGPGVYIIETDDDDNRTLAAHTDYSETIKQGLRYVAGRRGGGGGGCFPGSSLVKLSSGESRPMRDVETGDSVMTMVEGRMTTTKVLGFVAKSVSSSTEYLNIRTEDGRSLSISQTHVIFVSDPYGNSKDVMAKDVNIGDRVMVQDGDHVKKSVVVEIGLEAMVGAYVPLTEH